MSEESVTLEASFTKKFGAGLFGGEGFVLQKISGLGMFWAEISGECQEYTLQAGQIMRVSPGHIAMCEPTVSYDIQAVKGITNMLFAGEGLFLATLTGPGKVWLLTWTQLGISQRAYPAVQRCAPGHPRPLHLPLA